MKNPTTSKDRIQFSHTFRHIQNRPWKSFFYLILFVIPVLLVFVLNYRDLSLWMNQVALFFLKPLIPSAALQIDAVEFLPIFGSLTSLSLPSPNTSTIFIIVLALVSLIALLILVTGRRKGHPVSIFLSFAAIILLISSAFGFLFPNNFPYGADDFAQLYMIQTFATLLFFIVLTGTVTVLLGIGSTIHRMVFVLVVLGFMMVFSTARYIVYLFIVSKVSLLFMPALIFAFGPFFDFLFLVYFYGIYIHHLIKRFKREGSEVVWQW